MFLSNAYLKTNGGPQYMIRICPVMPAVMDSITYRMEVANKVELPLEGIFFCTQFPSLEIFINKKVGN